MWVPHINVYNYCELEGENVYKQAVSNLSKLGFLVNIKLFHDRMFIKIKMEP